LQKNYRKRDQQILKKRPTILIEVFCSLFVLDEEEENCNKLSDKFFLHFSFQLVLDEGDENDRKMADKLIAIYFSFFKASIKKGDIDSKLVSTVIVQLMATNYSTCPVVIE
jgi:hypothetical protein